MSETIGRMSRLNSIFCAGVAAEPRSAYRSDSAKNQPHDPKLTFGVLTGALAYGSKNAGASPELGGLNLLAAQCLRETREVRSILDFQAIDRPLADQKTVRQQSHKKDGKNGPPGSFVAARLVFQPSRDDGSNDT